MADGINVHTDAVFVDHSADVKARMDANADKALTAMGIKAVNLILWQMERGFKERIWRTGNLQRDVQYHVDESARCVYVGNTLHYAPYVHDGTRKMAARPYITNALTGEQHKEELKKVAEAYLQIGFKEHYIPPEGL